MFGKKKDIERQVKLRCWDKSGSYLPLRFIDEQSREHFRQMIENHSNSWQTVCVGAALVRIRIQPSFIKSYEVPE